MVSANGLAVDVILTELLDDLRARGRRADPFTPTFHILDHRPDLVTPLVEMVLEQVPDAGPWFADALSFVPAEHVPRLVQSTMDWLSQESNASRESAVAHLSLQFPELFHPHLDLLLDLRPNWDSYCCSWPWRESGFRHLVRLCSEPALRPLLLETRLPEVLARVEDEECREVGFSDGRALYSSDSRHLVFPPEYLAQPVPHLARRHPTWRLEADFQTPFGGPGEHICACCGQQGHHLLTLPLARLETCLSCLGWEQAPLFYSHGSDELPRPIGPRDTRQPQYRVPPLRRTLVGVARTPPRWRWQDWGYSNGRQNLNRIGGYPSWVQAAEYPECPGCQRCMKLLLQLDTLPLESGEEFLWGSGGLGYAFWCDKCRVSAFLYQCT